MCLLAITSSMCSSFRRMRVFQPLGRQQQTLDPRAANRARVLPAMALKLTTRLTRPPLAALSAGDDPLRIELQLDRRAIFLVLLGRLSSAVLTGELLPGLTQELTPPLAGAQPLRQLITTLLAVLLVLILIGHAHLSQDLQRDLLKLTGCIGVGVARQAGAIDRDQPRLDQPRLITQTQ